MKLTKEQVIALFTDHYLIDSDSRWLYEEVVISTSKEDMLLLICKCEEEYPRCIKADSAVLDVSNKTITFQHYNSDTKISLEIVSAPSSDDLCDALNIPINYN